MKTIKKRNFILVVFFFAIILYKKQYISYVNMDIGEFFYYLFFHIGKTVEGGLFIRDVVYVFMWQILLFLLFGTYFEDNIIKNETILFTRAAKRGKLYIDYALKLIIKIFVFLTIVFIMCSMLNRSVNTENIIYIIGFFCFCINFVFFINLAAIRFKLKYVMILFLFFEYAEWSIGFLRHITAKYNLFELFSDKMVSRGNTLFLSQIVVFLILQCIGISLLERKESI